MKSVTEVGYKLDAIDKKIIYMLMDNAKTSLAQISKNIGISTTAVHQRIKKLGGADEAGQKGRHLHALPAGPSRRRGHRCGDRRAAIGGVRRGREPPSCPEGDPGLGAFLKSYLASAI